MNTLETTMLGALAMGLLIASLFFFNFWIRTRDTFFGLFSLAFLIEALGRVIFACMAVGNESEPLFYLPRLVAYGLIVTAVIQKNRPSNSNR